MNEKQIRCIEMLCDENENITHISEVLGVSRTTIYNWMRDERFKAALAECEQDIKNRTHHIFVCRLPAVIEKLYKLTDCADNRTKLQAVKEWIERAIGKVNTAVTFEDKRTESDELSMDDLVKKVDEMLKAEEKTAP